MKKKIFGITALLAVLAMALMFTTCGADFLNGGDDPDAEYSCIFVNHSAAKITLIFTRGKPSSFTLEPAANTGDDTKTQTVTNTGKKIVLSSISFEPSMPDPWKYVEFANGSTANVGKSGKDGVELISGKIIFRAVQGNGYLDYKIDTVDE